MSNVECPMSKILRFGLGNPSLQSEWLLVWAEPRLTSSGKAVTRGWQVCGPVGHFLPKCSTVQGGKQCKTIFLSRLGLKLLTEFLLTE